MSIVTSQSEIPVRACSPKELLLKWLPHAVLENQELGLPILKIVVMRH